MSVDVGSVEGRLSVLWPGWDDLLWRAGWTVVTGVERGAGVPRSWGGWARLEDRRVELFVGADEATLAHEVGHALDYEHMSWEQRDEWLRIRGVEGLEWWPEVPGEVCGAEDFAEAWVWWSYAGVPCDFVRGARRRDEALRRWMTGFEQGLQR